MAAETDQVDVKPNFSVFKLYLVLTFKLLIANHKTTNLMLKLKITGAQSQLLSCYARLLYIGSHLSVGLHTCIIANCSFFLFNEPI